MDVCGRLVTLTVRGRGRGLSCLLRKMAARQGALNLENFTSLSHTYCPALCIFVWVDMDLRGWTSGDSDGARQGTRVVVSPPPADGDKARRPRPVTSSLC